MIRIIIADDHHLIREGLRKILRNESDMSIIADVGDTKELFVQLSKNKVDVVVLDVNMPGRSGIDVLSDLKKEFPEIRILMLSMHAEDSLAVRAIKSGASGYLTKNAASEEIAKAIRKIYSGRKYITETLAEKLATEVQSESPVQSHQLLSDREFEVFQLLGSGLTVTEIAKRLSISVPTVSTYRARILEKLNMTSTAEIIHYAVKNNLIE